MILLSFDRVSPGRLPERMDAPDADPEALEESLDALDWTNRWLGGRRLVASPVLSFLRDREPGPLRLLDVGAGGGDIPADLARKMASRGWRPRFVLGDLRAPILRSARRRIGVGRTFRFVRLSGVALPFPDDAFDLAVSSTTLHHLERDEAVAFVGEMARVARAGWLISDLRRSRTAYAALLLLAHTLWRARPYPRRDGPVSIRRSFTREELEGVLAAAGVGPARVLRAAPFRLLAVGGELARSVGR